MERADIMEKVAPLGPAYQAGTMAGNPASIAAGIACLETLRQPGVYERMSALAEQLANGIADGARRHGIPLTINRVGLASDTGGLFSNASSVASRRTICSFT